MNATAPLGLELDLHRLERPYAHTRLERPEQVRRLMHSLEANGQQVPLVVLAQGERFLLLDGYQRWAALTRLGRDTARVEVWSGELALALMQLLARHQGHAFEPIEQAWLVAAALAEGLTQRAVASALGKDPSWVSRRLALLAQLSEPLQEAVRQGVLSSWAASRVLVPLARQRRRGRHPARGPAPGTALHPRARDLVPPLRDGQQYGPRAHGRPSAAVHPGPAGARARQRSGGARGAVAGGAHAGAPSAPAPRPRPGGAARPQPPAGHLGGTAPGRGPHRPGARAPAPAATGGGACCRKCNARRFSSCRPRV